MAIASSRSGWPYTPGRDQVAHAAAAQEVADADIPPAVPREQHGAASGLAVVLGEIDLLVGDLVELALHHTVGPAQVNQVGLLSRPKPENDGRDRLAQSRLRRGVIVGNVDPLPFERHAGSDPVRIGSHQLGLHPPVPAQSKRQPVLAVAGVSGQRGFLARPENQNVGERVADQIDGG